MSAADGGTYRIDLNELEPGAWVDIHCKRTFGMALEANEAMAESFTEFCAKRAELYVTAWSFPGNLGRGTFMNLDEHIAARILTEATEHYNTHAPSEEESKG